VAEHREILQESDCTWPSDEEEEEEKTQEGIHLDDFIAL